MIIFVSVCSYRDPLLIYTINSLLEQKSGLHRIFIGVFEQTEYKDSIEYLYPDTLLQYEISQINSFDSVEGGIIYKRIDPKYSDGVGWARSINQHAMDPNKYDFLYQIDSHMVFDKDWDAKLIDDYVVGTNQSHSEDIIITGCCKVFDLDESGVPIKTTSNRVSGLVLYHPDINESFIISAIGSFTPVWDHLKNAIHICAGNTLFPSKWVKDVGNDPLMFFDAEEHCLTIRSYAAGYRLYHPTELMSYHYVNTGNYPTKQWFEPVSSMQRYSRNVQRSQERFKQVISEIPIEILNKYYEYSGVDYINKKLDDKALVKFC